MQFGIAAPCGILSRLAARIDPCRMAYRLFERLGKRGGRVFDRTCIATIEPGTRSATLRTQEGVGIRCKQVVMAAGYANEQWLGKRVARNRSNYAFITDPIAANVLGYLAGTLVWESARPYLYLRSTGDGRLLVGGEDDSVDIPLRRDLRVRKEASMLVAKMAGLFPHLPLRPAFSRAGTFAETSDGLPFFGPHPQSGPRVHYAMAYGGNGISYSMIGAGLLRCLNERRKHPLAKLFSFARLG